MKNYISTYILILVSLCCTFQISYAQYIIDWEKNYGGSGTEWAREIIQTTDGGFALAGYSNSIDGDLDANYGEDDLWVVKIDESGNIEWQKNYGGSLNDRAQAIKATSDGGFIVAAESESSDGDISANNGSYDICLFKLDSEGNIEWQKNYGGIEREDPTDLILTPDGGYILTGTNSSNSNGFQDYWILKVNSTGDVEWDKTYGGSNTDRPSAIITTNDGGYIVAGSAGSPDFDVNVHYGFTDFWILKLNATGDIEWQKTYGGTYGDSPGDIIQLANGDYIIAGSTFSIDTDVSNQIGDGDFWIIRINSTGDLLWEKTYGGTGTEGINSIQETADGNFIAAGYSFSGDVDLSGNYGDTDFWIIKIDGTGSLLWQQNYGGSNGDGIFSILQTDDLGFMAFGSSFSSDNDVSNNNGSADFWLVKIVDPFVNTSQPEILHVDIFPNPSSDVLNIHLAKAEKVHIQLTNTLGQVVADFHTNEQHNKINLKQLAIGPYFLKINKNKSFKIIKN